MLRATSNTTETMTKVAAKDLCHATHRAVVEQAPRPVHLEAQQVVDKVGDCQRNADAVEDVTAKAYVAVRPARDPETKDARDPRSKPCEPDHPRQQPKEKSNWQCAASKN